MIIEKRANFHLLQAVPRGKGTWQKYKGDNRKADTKYGMENFNLLQAVPRGKEDGRKKGKGEDIGKVKDAIENEWGQKKRLKKKMRKWKGGEEEDWIFRPIFPDLTT